MVLRLDVLEDMGTETPTTKAKHRDCTGLLLYNTMLPFVRSMQMFGLYFNSAEKCKDTRPERGKSVWSVAKIYSTCILIIIWFNQLRFWSIFSGGDQMGPELFEKLIFVSWFSHCAANITSMYYACSSVDGMEAFLFTWHRIHSVECSLNLADYGKKTSIYVAAAWIFWACNVAFCYYGLFDSFFFDYALAPYKPGDDYVKYVRITYAIIHLWLTAAWSMVDCFALFILSLMYWEFKAFNEKFRSRINEDGSFSGDLEQWRQQHEKLSSLVSTADNATSAHIAATFAACIVMSILILYNLIWWPEVVFKTPLIGFIHAFWFATAFGSVSFLAVWAASVNHAAHALWADVQHISLKEDTPACLRSQVTAFMHRLGGPAIGFSTGGLFVVDKQCILTLLHYLDSIRTWSLYQ
ncbi:hypothetical protein CAPTEDRAFT_210189 [Capitella teleta]|uniref:Gustatory receptor n=1 Tax=Capitella teleta TaxID=283909 RepID=R7TW28_CAPTE|nr:hypothetical protein CAPTEDRAFT_210189 [Capitella teleta]|eukprot:ELT97787.1 hypothetical protein CAPTEDRAFT_210189 [Capitella teleta]